MNEYQKMNEILISLSVCNNNHIDIKVSLTKIFIDKKISDNMFMYFSDNYVIESI